MCYDVTSFDGQTRPSEALLVVATVQPFTQACADCAVCLFAKARVKNARSIHSLPYSASENAMTSATGKEKHIHIVATPGAVSIMAIAAHPDDIESWSAGTLTRAIAQGAIVRLLLAISGEHGSSDPCAQAHEVTALCPRDAQRV